MPLIHTYWHESSKLPQLLDKLLSAAHLSAQIAGERNPALARAHAELEGRTTTGDEEAAKYSNNEIKPLSTEELREQAIRCACRKIKSAGHSGVL